MEMETAPQETAPEIQVSATSAELNGWLSDLRTHGGTLLEAVRAGRVIVSTADFFNRLAEAAKTAKANEKLAQKTRQYAEEYARDRADLAAQNAALTEQVVACRNAVYYLLKSFDGVAAKADLIMETARILGLSDDGKMPSMPAMLMKLTFDGTRIMSNAQQVLAGFDPSWLKRIDVEALRQLMEGTELDLHGFDRLTDLLHTLYPQTTIQIPATTNG